jgi:alpha-glucosidase
VLHRELPTAEEIERGRARSLAAILAILALPGTTYLYNGQELGLEEVIDLPDHLRQDPQFARTGGAWLGRDGCRVPLPWTLGGTSLGFSPAGAAPWLPQPASWAERSVEAQEADEASFLRRVQRAIAVRRREPSLLHGALAWDDAVAPAGVLSFRRAVEGVRTVACVVTMGDAPAQLPEGEVLVASVEPIGGVLPPDAAAWVALG